MSALTMPVGTLICDLSEKGVKLSVICGDLKVEAPKGKVTSNILGILKDRKPEIIRELQSPKDDLQFGKMASLYRSAKLPNRIHLEEAVSLYQKRGYIQIFSGYLNQSIYLVKNKATRVPDPSFPRYTKEETEALRGLTLDELKTLHEAKQLFKGTINDGEN
jgi:hypothetical protein